MLSRNVFILAAALIATGVAGSLAVAAANVSKIDRCNSLYHDTSYEQAITCYQALSSEGISAEILYNIGNSYAQLDQTGRAVLHYLRALCLAPDDSDISGNLSLIRKEKGLFPKDPSFSEQFFGLFSVTQWSLLCLSALVIYLTFSLFRIKKGRSLLLESLVVILCVALLVLGASGAILQYQQWQHSVVINDSKLLVSPFSSASSIGQIQSGRLVIIHKQHNAFRYVTDETGRKGWIQDSAIEPIIP